MTTRQEQQFLRCAGDWLTCRMYGMGGRREEDTGWNYHPVDWLVAELCQAAEMHFILKEHRVLNAEDH